MQSLPLFGQPLPYRVCAEYHGRVPYPWFVARATQENLPLFHLNPFGHVGLAFAPHAPNVAEHDAILHAATAGNVAVEMFRRVLHEIAAPGANRVERVVELKNVAGQRHTLQFGERAQLHLFGLSYVLGRLLLVLGDDLQRVLPLRVMGHTFLGDVVETAPTVHFLGDVVHEHLAVTERAQIVNPLAAPLHRESSELFALETDVRLAEPVHPFAVRNVVHVAQCSYLGQRHVDREREDPHVVLFRVSLRQRVHSFEQVEIHFLHKGAELAARSVGPEQDFVFVEHVRLAFGHAETLQPLERNARRVRTNQHLIHEILMFALHGRVHGFQQLGFAVPFALLQQHSAERGFARTVHVRRATTRIFDTLFRPLQVHHVSPQETTHRVHRSAHDLFELVPFVNLAQNHVQ